MLEPVRRLAALFTLGTQPPKDDPQPEPERLYRFGLDWESTKRLARQSAQAEANGFPHGVSAVNETIRVDVGVASRTEVERHFSVMKTGRNLDHYTVVLPKPMTDDAAELFNRLFGRTR